MIGELDSYVLATAVRHTPYYDEEDLRPMTLFGVTFNHSPSQLYFLHYTDYVTRPWLHIREQLLGLTTEEQISRIRQLQDTNGVLNSLSLRTFDYELRPLWRSAAVMAASRIYLLDHGAWPSQVSDLGASVPFEAEFELSQSDGGLKILETATNNAWVLR